MSDSEVKYEIRVYIIEVEGDSYGDEQILLNTLPIPKRQANSRIKQIERVFKSTPLNPHYRDIEMIV